MTMKHNQKMENIGTLALGNDIAALFNAINDYKEFIHRNLLEYRGQTGNDFDPYWLVNAYINIIRHIHSRTTNSTMNMGSTLTLVHQIIDAQDDINAEAKKYLKFYFDFICVEETLSNANLTIMLKQFRDTIKDKRMLAEINNKLLSHAIDNGDVQTIKEVFEDMKL